MHPVVPCGYLSRDRGGDGGEEGGGTPAGMLVQVQVEELVRELIAQQRLHLLDHLVHQLLEREEHVRSCTCSHIAQGHCRKDALAAVSAPSTAHHAVSLSIRLAT